MIKISIKNLEKLLDFKIKKNFKSIGFDTANRTGICFIDTTSKDIKIDWMFIEFKDAGSKKQKYITMVNTFADILDKQNLAVVEDVFVGFNRKGSIELARFGSFAIAESIKKGIDFETISAMSARAKFQIDARLFGKGKSKKAVAYWLEKKFDIKLDDEDISDAIILALIGVCDGIKYEK